MGTAILLCLSAIDVWQSLTGVHRFLDASFSPECDSQRFEHSWHWYTLQLQQLRQRSEFVSWILLRALSGQAIDPEIYARQQLIACRINAKMNPHVESMPSMLCCVFLHLHRFETPVACSVLLSCPVAVSNIASRRQLAALSRRWNLWKVPSCSNQHDTFTTAQGAGCLSWWFDTIWYPWNIHELLGRGADGRTPQLWSIGQMQQMV